MVDCLNPAIKFGLAGNSSLDCNSAYVFRKTWKKFAGADFEQNIANRMSNFDIRMAEKMRNFAHHIPVRDNRLQDEVGHLAVEFRRVGVKNLRCVVAVMKDDPATGSGKTDGLTHESSRICNVADNSVGQDQIVLSIMGSADLAVGLVIFNIFQPGFCCDVLRSINQLS